MIEQPFTIDDPRIEPCPMTGCWLWVLLSQSNGYSKTTVPSTGRRGMAHRLTWEAAHGPIPTGMQIDHVCKNRACVNPDHLRVVTVAQNSTENSTSPTARNKAKQHCPRCGSQYKLTKRGRMCLPCNKAWRKNRRLLMALECEQEARERLR